jgi:hypothetical protein
MSNDQKPCAYKQGSKKSMAKIIYLVLAVVEIDLNLTSCTLSAAFPALPTNIFGIVILVFSLSSLSK